MLRTSIHRAAVGGLAALTGFAGLTVVGGAAQASAPAPRAKAGTVATWGPGPSEAESGVPGGIAPPTLPVAEAGTAFVKALANGPVTLLALTDDGRVVRAGTSVFGTTLPDALQGAVVKDIAADSYEGGAAVTDAGDVITWGPGIEGFLTALPSDPLHGIRSIAVEQGSGAYAAAVTAAGDVIAWGADGAAGQLDVPAGLTGVTRVAVSIEDMYALKSDGTVVAWGSNTFGQRDDLPEVLTDPQDDVDVTDVVANGSSALALLSDGSLVAWGSATSHGTPAGTLNDVPAALTGKTVVAIGGDGASRYEAVDSDGNAYVWGEDPNPPAAFTQIPSGTDATKIASLSLNNYFAAALVTKVLSISKPTISGTPKVGQTLTATPGTFSGVTADQVTGQWFVGGTKIDGAVGTTYTPTANDVCKAITYRSSAPGGADAVASSSASTGAVAPADASQRAASVATVSAPATTYGRGTTVTVTVSDAAGCPVAGNVTLAGAGAAQTKSVGAAGRVTFALPRNLPARSYALAATYAGSAVLKASSGRGTLSVVRTAAGAPVVKIAKNPSRKKAGKATIRVAAPAGLAAATGKVTVTLKLGRTTKRVSGRLRAGAVTVKLPKLPKKGKWKVTATYAGDANYVARASRPATVRVK